MNKKILIIEDDSFFHKFYTAKLSEKGYEVDFAENGKDGLTKLRNGNFHLVILDLVMPQIDGFAVLKERSHDENIQKIPFIVLTSLSQDKDSEEVKSLGANDYINKTFTNIPELLMKINKLIG